MYLMKFVKLNLCIFEPTKLIVQSTCITLLNYATAPIIINLNIRTLNLLQFICVLNFVFVT